MLEILAILKKLLIFIIAKINCVSKNVNSSYKCSIKVVKIAKISSR